MLQVHIIPHAASDGIDAVSFVLIGWTETILA